MPDTPGGGVKVNKDNVRQVAKVFQDGADRLEKRVEDYSGRLITQPVMGDPVSAAVATALNGKFVYDADSYVERIRAQAKVFQTTAAQLVESAKSYGYTDEDIASILSKVHDEPPQVPMSQAEWEQRKGGMLGGSQG